MPVCIPDALPAAKVLASENIFVMTRQRSTHQDIRPLHIAVLNLMPTKEATETQLLRLIGNTPLQVHVTLLRTATYESQHTAHRHLSTFYRTFEEVRGEKFDALIITGALPGQEQGNPEFVERYGLGVASHGVKSLPGIVTRLLENDGAELTRIREAQQKYRRFDNAKRIAEAARDLALQR